MEQDNHLAEAVLLRTSEGGTETLKRSLGELALSLDIIRAKAVGVYKNSLAERCRIFGVIALDDLELEYENYLEELVTDNSQQMTIYEEVYDDGA